jgi:DNA-binding NarL/FixJ family response regulator
MATPLSSVGISEKALLKELAEERRKNKPQLEERNRKIRKMAEQGCDYRDIAGRYGLSRDTIDSIVKGGRWRNSRSWDRACYVDGIQ